MLERITLSNMHQEAKAQSRVILYPLHLPKDKWSLGGTNCPVGRPMSATFAFISRWRNRMQILLSCVFKTSATGWSRTQRPS